MRAIIATTLLFSGKSAVSRVTHLLNGNSSRPRRQEESVKVIMVVQEGTELRNFARMKLYPANTAYRAVEPP